MMILLFFLWIEPECISNLDVPCKTPDAAMDRFGKFHVVWYAGEDFNDWDVYYSKSADKGWTPAEKIWDAELSCQETKISTDNSGNPHILWVELLSDTYGRLYYMYHNGIEWIGPINLSDTFNIPNIATPDIEIDNNSNIHIVWDNCADGNVYYSKNSGYRWETSIRITDLPGSEYFPDIALWNNRIFVVWYNSYYDELYLTQYNGNQWLSPVNVSKTGNRPSRDPSIAVDKFGIAMVVWHEYHPLYFNRYPWTDTTMIWTNTVLNPDIIVDKSNIPHITVPTGTPVHNPELRYATLTDSGWIYEVIPIGDLWEPTNPVCMVDSMNNKHVIFRAKYTDHPDIDIYYTKIDNSGVIEEKNRDFKGTVISLNGRINLNINEDTDYSLYDLTGKLIKKGIFSSYNVYLDVRDISSGIYLIRLGDRYTDKVIIIR